MAAGLARHAGLMWQRWVLAALAFAQAATAQWVDAAGNLRGPPVAPSPSSWYGAPPAPHSQADSGNLGYWDDLELWVIVAAVLLYIGIALKLGKNTPERSPLERYVCCWGDLYLGRAAWIFNVIFCPAVLLVHAIRIYICGALAIYLRRLFWLACGVCSSYFTDSEFPPQDQSLGTVGGDSAHGPCAQPGADGSTTVWVRAQDFGKPDVLQQSSHPHLSNSDMSLFEGKIEAKDILQGALGDCWLLAAMATLAEHEGIISSLFLTREVDPRGKYRIRLFCPQEKQWKVVVVDDYVPCKRDNHSKDGVLRGADHMPETKYTRPNGKEIWVMMLEKAFAKFCGNYAAIEGGITEWGIVCLTGGNAWRYEAKPEGWRRSDLTIQEDQKDKRACGFLPTAETHSSAELFDLIRHYHRHRAVLCCGGVKDAGKAAGLVPQHAFSLLQVRTVGTSAGSHEYFRFVQIRNPWGTGEWTGPWSDTSPLWEQYPYVRKQLGFEKSDDGAYWMQWEDFCEYWGYVGCVDVDTDIGSLLPPVHSESDPLGPLKAAAEGCVRFWCCCDGLRRFFLRHEATSEPVPRATFEQTCGVDPSGLYCRVCEHDPVHFAANGGKLVKEPHEVRIASTAGQKKPAQPGGPTSTLLSNAWGGA